MPIHADHLLHRIQLFDQDVERLRNNLMANGADKGFAPAAKGLASALDAKSRDIETVAEALDRVRSATFTNDEVFWLFRAIETGESLETGVDQYIVTRHECANEANRLYQEYAHIHGVRVEIGRRGSISIDWTNAAGIDTKTGQGN